MSEMVEQVARALHKAHYERGRGLARSWEPLDKFEKEMWLFSARAAIEAMREPTKKMVQEALCSANFPIGTWEAMIDEALK